MHDILVKDYPIILRFKDASSPWLNTGSLVKVNLIHYWDYLTGIVLSTWHWFSIRRRPFSTIRKFLDLAEINFRLLHTNCLPNQLFEFIMTGEVQPSLVAWDPKVNRPQSVKTTYIPWRLGHKSRLYIVIEDGLVNNPSNITKRNQGVCTSISYCHKSGHRCHQSLEFFLREGAQRLSTYIPLWANR